MKSLDLRPFYARSIREVEKLLAKVRNPHLATAGAVPILERMKERMVRDLAIEKAMNRAEGDASDWREHRRYFSADHWLFVHGRLFTWRRPRKPHPFGLPKAFFENSLRYGFSERGLMYVEGMVDFPRLIEPMPHAWNSDHQERVMDFTLRPKVFTGARTYFGAAFDPVFVSSSLREGRACLDDSTPLLKDDALLGEALQD